MKCKNCNAEITFLRVLKQPSPFRFKCSECKAKYKVSTPGMTAILVGVVVAFFGLTAGLCTVTEELGVLFSIPYIAIMIGAWLVLEVWTHRYISRRGTFTRLGSTEPPTPPYSENRDGSPHG